MIGSEAVETLWRLPAELLGNGSAPADTRNSAQIFVRRYTPDTRPWSPFHVDSALVTLNVALSDEAACDGGELLALHEDGVRCLVRGEGDATVHSSTLLHAVRRLASGARYSLIIFIGEAERRLPPELRFDEAARAAEAAALTTLMESTALASAAASTLGVRPLETLRGRYSALQTAGVVGTAIEHAVQKYAAPHLRPSSILARVQSGQADAACWSLGALLRYAYEEVDATSHDDDDDDDAAVDVSDGSTDGAYVIKETAHAGRAVFAARRLAAGSILIHEVPLRATNVDELERIAGQCGALDNLCGEGASSRVAQNYFADEANGECLLFRRVSMLNHSCRPSASIRLEGQGAPLDSEPPRAAKSASVVLARDVDEGEEVTLCYSGAVLFAPRPERQAALHGRWGFACHCERCRDGALTEAEASMWVRLEAAAAAAEYAKPRGPAGDKRLAAQQREALSLIEAELPCLVERERFRYDADYFD